MPALATIDDVIALGADPSAVTPEMLEQASARFRAEAGGHLIEAHTYTQVLRPAGGYVRLPRLPVLEVVGVNMLTDSGAPGAAITGWVFNGIDTVDIRGVGDVWVNGPGWDDHAEERNVSVVWSAGYDPIPEDVRWTVAAMVHRAVTSGPAGVVSEQIGDFSRTFGAFTASGAMSMTREERDLARRYRPRRSSVAVRAW